MDDNTPQSSSWSSRLAFRVRNIRSRSRNRSRNGRAGAAEGASASASGSRKLTRKRSALPVSRDNRHDEMNEMGERRAYSIFSDSSTLVDSTDILHGLATTNFDMPVDDTFAGDRARFWEDAGPALRALRRRIVALVAAITDEAWERIASYLDPVDRASLALVNKVTFTRFAPDAFFALSSPDTCSMQQRLRFLHRLDIDLPYHLLCFNCGCYHRRILPGEERLKADYINHPVFVCPLVRNTVLPRTRVAHGRELPYHFVQLAVRAAKYGPEYGISPDTLSRRWRDAESGWSHQTRYLIHRGHLLLRVRTQVWAPPNLTASQARLLIFDRDHHTPFFSVCSHWRDGELTKVCKCVLSHVPEPPASTMQKIRSGPGAALKQPMQKIIGAPGAALRPPPPRAMQPKSSSARTCGFCQPARRCPECPSEYLAKITLSEDRDDAVQRFKWALVVTRWCDLGDGSGPLASEEWASSNGLLSDSHYPSFEKVKNRALMGTFESAVSGITSGSRLLNMNPEGVKKGEGGNQWY